MERDPAGRPRLLPGLCLVSIGDFVDSQGNVANGTHSTSSESYGSGIWVDGVIINRPVFLRKFKNMPAGITTAQWVFKDGKPVYALATTTAPSWSVCCTTAIPSSLTWAGRLRIREAFGHPHRHAGH